MKNINFEISKRTNTINTITTITSFIAGFIIVVQCASILLDAIRSLTANK